jgi:hypothetical protein
MWVLVEGSKFHCENSFEELKKRLTSAPVLILSDPKEYFVVYCDASKMWLGGVRMQKKKQVVAYESRQLRSTQSNPFYLDKINQYSRSDNRKSSR